MTIVAAQAAPVRAQWARMLDLAERAAIAALYVYFIFNIVSGFLATREVFSLFLLASESTILLFVLFRRSTSDITRNPRDWSLGFAGTIVPLLVVPAGNPLLPPVVILSIMLAGILLQLSAKFVLRRSFGIVAANRGVKHSGPYQVIRHPMYAGYMLTELGFLLGSPTARNLAIYAVAWSLQVCRILVEEELLTNDTTYRALIERVPYRLIPRLF